MVKAMFTERVSSGGVTKSDGYETQEVAGGVGLLFASTSADAVSPGPSSTTGGDVPNGNPPR
jgi:hypothetical protein